MIGNGRLECKFIVNRPVMSRMGRHRRVVLKMAVLVVRQIRCVWCSPTSSPGGSAVMVVSSWLSSESILLLSWLRP